MNTSLLIREDRSLVLFEGRADGRFDWAFFERCVVELVHILVSVMPSRYVPVLLCCNLLAS